VQVDPWHWRWDAMTDRDDEDDPLLVRPYIHDKPGGSALPASGPTWPASPVAAEPPVPEPADPTVVLPVPASAPRRSGRRRLVLALAAALVLVLAGVAALVSSLLPRAEPGSALPNDVPLPAPVVSEPAPATTATPDADTTTAPAATRSRNTTSPTATPSSPSPAATVRTSAAPSRPATSPPAAPMLIAPPADRVGRIHGPGGLCLDLNGAIAVDNNHIQVFTCNDSPAQEWNLGADGTLRVVGKCAVAADDGTVRIFGCDDRRSAQWRAGRNRTLVNLATGQCLTDPATGTRVGAGVRVEECSAAERQQWELP
jgi:hypothetical protein